MFQVKVGNTGGIGRQGIEEGKGCRKSGAWGAGGRGRCHGRAGGGVGSEQKQRR